MTEDLYFSYLSLYIDTSTKQLISYAILSFAFLTALVIVLTRLKELEGLFNIEDTGRGWFYKRLQFVGIGTFLALLIAGLSFTLSGLYFYGRTIEIVSRNDFSSVLVNATYGQFFTYMVDWVTIPTLNNYLPLTHLWTMGRLTILIHLAVGIIISAALVELYIRRKISRQTANQLRIHTSTTPGNILDNFSPRSGIVRPRTGPDERIAQDVYETFYGRRHTFICNLCGKFFDNEEELEKHSKECKG